METRSRARNRSAQRKPLNDREFETWTFGPFEVRPDPIGEDSFDLIVTHPDGWSLTLSTGGEGHMYAYATFHELPWAFDIYVESANDNMPSRRIH